MVGAATRSGVEGCPRGGGGGGWLWRRARVRVPGGGAVFVWWWEGGARAGLQAWLAGEASTSMCLPAGPLRPVPVPSAPPTPHPVASPWGVLSANRPRSWSLRLALLLPPQHRSIGSQWRGTICTSMEHPGPCPLLPSSGCRRGRGGPTGQLTRPLSMSSQACGSLQCPAQFYVGHWWRGSLIRVVGRGIVPPINGARHPRPGLLRQQHSAHVCANTGGKGPPSRLGPSDNGTYVHMEANALPLHTHPSR